MAQPVAAGDGDRTDPIRVLAGSLVAASRHLSRVTAGQPSEGEPGPREPDPRYVALGVACLVEDRLRAMTQGGAGVARTVAAPMAAVASRLIPSAVRRRLGQAVQQLDGYGRAAAAAGSDEAGGIIAAVAGDVARDPHLVEVIEQIVEQIQWHVVDDLLPGVLDRLAAEPDQVRALVQGQSRGMIEEVANAGRAAAAGGDDAVERLVSRLLRRRERGNGASAHTPPEATRAGPEGP